MSERNIGQERALAQELVNPVSSLVAAAVEKVTARGVVEKYPEMPGNNDDTKQVEKYKRKVYLYGDGSLFAITDLEVSKQAGGVVSTGPREMGLLIEEIKVGEKYKPLAFGLSIQTPREIESVVPNTVHHLINLNPTDMRAAAEKIRNAVVVRQATYDRAAQHMTAKLRAA